MVARIGSKWNSQTLLVEMQNDTTTLEDLLPWGVQVFFYFSHSIRCVAVLHHSFNLHFHGGEWCFKFSILTISEKNFSKYSKYNLFLITEAIIMTYNYYMGLELLGHFQGLLCGVKAASVSFRLYFSAFSVLDSGRTPISRSLFGLQLLWNYHE